MMGKRVGIPMRGMIHDLCISLEHRWEPGRIFVILTAYLDESGTHGGDATAANPASTVMAGMMGTAAQWGRFAYKFDRLRHKHGFRIFHTTDLVQRKNEFKGWSDQQCRSLVVDIAPLLEGKMMIGGVSFRLDNAEFKQQYRADKNPKGSSLDAEYGLCFRQCLLHFAIEAQNRLSHHKKWPETRLNFVLESGHRHSGDAIRVFNEVREDMSSVGEPLLGTIAFAAKYDSVELVTGDLLAYVTWSMDRLARADSRSVPQLFGTGEKKSSNLVHITHAENGLSNMRKVFADQARARRYRRKIKATALKNDAAG